MPCNSDYMNPTQEEDNIRKTSSLIVYTAEKLGYEADDSVKKAANDVYGRGVSLDNAVFLLCGMISTMTPEEMEAIVYNARDKKSRELADWWEEHEAADKKRLKKELDNINDEADKQVALAKLTARERKLLNL